MIKKIFMVNITSIFGIFLAVILSSCGSLRDEYINKFSNIVFNKDLINKGNITYLTKELIDNERAEPDSYLVAFRTQPNNLLPYLMGFKSEKFTFYKEIYHNIISEKDVKVVNFLTSFDINDQIEGLYFIDKKHRSLFKDLKNINYIKDLTSDKYNVLSKLLSNKGNLSSVKMVALAKVSFTDYKEAKRTLDRWNSKGIIEYAEPNYYNTLYDNAESWQSIYTQYKEVLESSMPYWHEMINLKDAFATLASQGKKITHPIVAVFDSGVDVEHPQLKNHIWHNPGVGIANCGEDTYGCNTASEAIGVLGDGNVYPVGASGYNAQADETKNGSHGTHVSGIIASDYVPGGNAYGGVCPVCQIMAIKQVDNKTGLINDMSIVRGFKYISYFQDEANPDGMVRIVNASLGKVERSRSVGIMLSKLKNTPKGKGVLVVAAAGNSDTNMYTYMAAFPEAIAVSNIGKGYIKHSSSNYGKWVNIAAPGEKIYSTIAAGQSDQKTGTSMACPVVAGVAGLVVSAYPDISQEELKKVLLVSSNSVKLYEVNPAYNMNLPGEDQQYHLLGIGVVDANLAVQKSTSQGNLYYTAQDRFTGLCGSINVIKKDGAIEYKDKIKKGINEIILFFIPVFITVLIGLRRKKICY